MSDSSVLPPGWIQVPLGNCGTWHGGSTPSKFSDPYWDKGTIPWISPKDMKTFRITVSEDHLAQVAIEVTNVKPFPIGMVLVVICSGILGRTLPVAVSQVIGTMNQDLKGIQPTSGIESEFFAYFRRAFEQDILRKGSKHGTTVASIDTASLHSYPLRIAPLGEQKRIVAKIEELFSDLDAGVAALERAKVNLKRYRAAVLKAAVEGKLTEAWRAEHPITEPASKLLERILAERRQKWESDQLAKYAAADKEPPKNWKQKYVEPTPPETTGLTELPADWCWASVQQVGSVQLGRQRAPQNHNGPHMRPYLRVANVFEDRIDLSDVMEMNFNPQEFETFRLSYGDILLNEGQSMEAVGRPAMYRDEMPGVCVTNSLVRFRVYDGVDTDYALKVFLAYLKNGRFQKIATITVNIAHLGAGRFSEIEFPLAPIDEQAAIIEEVDRHFSLIDAAEKAINLSLARASRLRQSILKQAFEGKLVPQDPNDQSASVLLERLRASHSAHEGNGKRPSSALPNRSKSRGNKP